MWGACWEVELRDPSIPISPCGIDVSQFVRTHVWQLGTIESVQPQLIVSSSVINDNSPIGVNRPLVKVGNDVCDCGTWVLNLYSAVGGERICRDGSVVVEPVGTVLPPNDSLNTRWVGSVGFVSVGGFLKETVIGAGEC